MSDAFPLKGGVKAPFGQWPNVGVYLTNNFPVGYELNVGFGDPLGDPVAGMRAVGVVKSWVDDATFQADCDAHGGIGGLLVSLQPAINVLLAAYFDTNPYLGSPISNTTPFSFDNVNLALAQYFAIQALPGTTHATLVRKSYP